jgi:hypothetical protein
MSRRQLCLASALASAGLMLSVSAAFAGDLCLDNSHGLTPTVEDPIIVARNFTLPKKNKCKMFAGLMAGEVGVFSGTACTSYDNHHVSIFITGALAPVPGETGGELSYRAYLEPATMTGSMAVEIGNTLSKDGLVAYECRNAFPDNL